MTRPIAFGEAAKCRLDASIHYARHLLAPEPEHLAAYGALVNVVQRRGMLLSRRVTGRGPDVNRGLVALAAHARDWLRPAGDWNSFDPSPRAQFASLAEHLFGISHAALHGVGVARARARRRCGPAADDARRLVQATR